MTCSLMAPLRRIFSRARQFATDGRAGLSVEAVFIFPVLLWGYFGMFILFDGYRALGTNTRAAYTISDMLSRETNAITSTYIEGLNDVLDVLTQSPHRTVLRVSVVSYDANTDELELDWSYSTAGVDAIVDSTLHELVPHIPNMNDPGVAIVVETYMAFVPFMNISLDAFYFEALVVTRPRFAPQLVWSNS